MRLRKKLAFIGAGAAVLAMTATGVAYWTTTGAGSGNATAKASNGTLVLHANFASNALAPGLSTPVSYTADNAGATDLQVATIHSVVSTSDVNCDPAWFSIADASSNVTVLAGASGTAVGSSTLAFANDASNQDACKGATITLTVSAS
jgi:hypothetical protein